MIKLKPYKKYKPSGVEWLGDIPEGWEVRRVKDVGDVVLGKMLNTTKADGYFLKKYLKSKNIGWANVVTNVIEEMYFSEDELNSYRIKKDDLLLSEGGEVGKTCIWNNEIDECYIQNSVHKITMNKSNSALFYFYCLYLIGKSGVYESIVNQVSIKHLTRQKLVIIPVVAPSLIEQKAIAEYLDEKTSKIDEKIKLLKDKKEKYQEFKKSLINETVCRGLDKNVKLKDSGIEWIGKIPEGWEVKRGKNIFKEYSKSKIAASEGLSKRKYKFFTSSDDQSMWLDYFVMENEGLLFSTGGSAGINFCESKYSYSTDCWCIYGKKICLKYYGYYFGSILHEIQQLAFQGAGLEHLQKDFIKINGVPNPSISEQTAIAKYLDKKTAKIDEIISTIDIEINKLAELRKTLINDVVTGKVKVI